LGKGFALEPTAQATLVCHEPYHGSINHPHSPFGRDVGNYSFVLLGVDFTLCCCLRTKCGWWWAFHSVKDIEYKFELKVWDIKSSVLSNSLANFVQNCEKHVCLRGTADGQISSFLWKRITRFYIRFQLIPNNIHKDA